MCVRRRPIGSGRDAPAEEVRREVDSPFNAGVAHRPDRRRARDPHPPGRGARALGRRPVLARGRGLRPARDRHPGPGALAGIESTLIEGGRAMKKLTKSALIGAVAASLAWATGLSVYAQVKRPYRNGTVWNVSMIRMKPGMDTAYLNYIAKDWKRNQEAAKKDGLL